eukprot:1269133-Pyramimonas_sp.AAC.1
MTGRVGRRHCRPRRRLGLRELGRHHLVGRMARGAQLKRSCEAKPEEPNSCRGREGRERGCTPNQNGAADCQGGAKIKHVK